MYKRLLVLSLMFSACGVQTYPKCMIFTTDAVTTKCGITITFNHGNGYLIESGQIDLSKVLYTTNGIYNRAGAHIGYQTGIANYELIGCDNLVTGTFYSLVQPGCTITVKSDNSLE